MLKHSEPCKYYGKWKRDFGFDEIVTRSDNADLWQDIDIVETGNNMNYENVNSDAGPSSFPIISAKDLFASSDSETSIESDSSEIVNSHRRQRLRPIPMSDSESDDEYCEDNIISTILWR